MVLSLMLKFSAFYISLPSYFFIYFSLTLYLSNLSRKDDCLLPFFSFFFFSPNTSSAYIMTKNVLLFNIDSSLVRIATFGYSS